MNGRDNLRGWAFSAPLVLFLAIPVVALIVSASPEELAEGLRNPMVRQAAWLSIQTSVVSLAIVVLFGTPLAWFISRSRRSLARAVETLVELPVVLPPAVLGVALLSAYGRRGLIGSVLWPDGGGIPFTVAAVVVAQVVVSAPFYVQSAVAGFRRVDDDVLLVAKSLGATPLRTFFRITVPAAMPALTAGAGLSWARALGEFGATLLFAGNLPGTTQTMPLAIYAALESDLGLARALAILLGGAAFGVLVALRIIPRFVRRRQGRAR